MLDAEGVGECHLGKEGRGRGLWRELELYVYLSMKTSVYETGLDKLTREIMSSRRWA